jgi:regulator of protease activity HflC (stomatin/prohibitin superfamily)
MFGFHYLKVNPTQYVIRFAGGKKRRAGAGISFVYYRPTTTIVVIPIGSTDVPFIFEQMTSDFQTVTVQGQLTYRIVDPEKVATLLDYSVESRMNRYRSDDPEKLSQRLVNQAQIISRAAITSVPLRAAILSVDQIATDVFATLNADTTLKALGVEILSLTISHIKPIPEMARALEAEARETLLRQSDDAIYSRRNAAIEQERKIKENELNTEIAVEEKQRQIRETQAAANLAVEAKEQELREQKMIGETKIEDDRKRLITLQSANSRAQADAEGYALRASLTPLTEVSPDVLQALSLQTAEPRLMIAKAINEIARNAGKIGQLNISPDLLQTLLASKEAKPK